MSGAGWRLFVEQGGVSRGRRSQPPAGLWRQGWGGALLPLLSWGGGAVLGAPEAGDPGAAPDVLMGTPRRFSEVRSSGSV